MVEVISAPPTSFPHALCIRHGLLEAILALPTVYFHVLLAQRTSLSVSVLRGIRRGRHRVFGVGMAVLVLRALLIEQRKYGRPGVFGPMPSRLDDHVRPVL